MSNNSQYVFIVSCGHSGSTLLDMILGAHKDISSLGEVTRFTDYITHNRMCTCGKKILECDFWAQVTSRLSATEKPYEVSVRMKDLVGKYQKLKILFEFFVAVWCPPKIMKMFVLLLNDDRMKNSHNLYETARDIDASRVLVDSSKSPFRAKLMYLQFPKNVKIIYLVRNGKDVVTSYIRHRGLSVNQASRLWRRHWYTSKVWLYNVPESDKLSVRYEQLTANPLEEISRICRFIGVDFQESMLDFRDTEHHNIGGNPMRFRNEGIFNRPRSWVEHLTKDDLRVFERISGGIKLDRN